MKKLNYLSIFCFCLILLAANVFVSAQKRTKVAEKPKPVIFAVLDDGQTLEPIAGIDNGELVEITNGGSDPKDLAAFAKNFYKPNTKYGLIFGGKLSGTATVKSSNPKSECGKNLATATTQSPKAKLKGFVMALATNAKTQPAAQGVRRLPTFAERTEIEALVRAEFAKQGVSAETLKDLHYHNLTALDVDNDGSAEMVGTFWVESPGKERNQLFFIAEKSDGNYQFNHSEYAKITPNEIMSGELKDLDEGIGSELLLDVYDYNGDKTAEIFTINSAFEGANFHVYSRKNGKWTRVYESYNYHCAY